MEIKKILDHFKGVTRKGKGYMALCPAHNDHHPSLSIGFTEDGQRVLIHCFAGCATKDILKEAGLTMSDLYVAKQEPIQKQSIQTIIQHLFEK